MTKDNINGFWNVDFGFFKQTYFFTQLWKFVSWNRNSKS